MAKYCIMCGDRISGTPTPDRCQSCWDMHTMIEGDTKLAREVYDRYVLETLCREKRVAFYLTLVELE